MAGAEIGLTRAIGVAVDEGNFDLAQMVIDRLRTIAQRSGEVDSLAESLAYLRVAKLKMGSPITETKQPS